MVGFGAPWRNMPSAYGMGQDRLCHHVEGPLEGEGKQQSPEGVP
jgi:hypothetical protein